MRGRFVVLEGGDGSGKSTQVPRLADWLRGHFSIEVVVTREPGGTRLGGALRALVLEGEDSVDPVAEALLMAADRAQHVAEVIRPALARGAWVLSDRHVPSSLVYQGIVRGLGVEAIETVNTWATGGLTPDLVVVLDVSDDIAAGRRPGAPDRLEREGEDFHAGVRAAYRDLALERGWCVVDGSGSPETVADRVTAAVTDCLAP
ncbi:MAG: dTMP kinase [Acidimicrobiia bacterium]